MYVYLPSPFLITFHWFLVTLPLFGYTLPFRSFNLNIFLPFLTVNFLKNKKNCEFQNSETVNTWNFKN